MILLLNKTNWTNPTHTLVKYSLSSSFPPSTYIASLISLDSGDPSFHIFTERERVRERPWKRETSSAFWFFFSVSLLSLSSPGFTYPLHHPTRLSFSTAPPTHHGAPPRTASNPNNPTFSKNHRNPRANTTTPLTNLTTL